MAPVQPIAIHWGGHVHCAHPLADATAEEDVVVRWGIDGVARVGRVRAVLQPRPRLPARRRALRHLGWY